MENQSKWKTPRGFDTLNKRENWNQLPKQPDLAKREELLIPYFEEKLATKVMLQSNDYNPAEHGGLDFMTKIKQQPLFSERNYFKSVFISGESIEKEEQEWRKKEIDEFNKKVVVDNKVFKVNTIV